MWTHIVQLWVSLLSHWKLHFNLLHNNCKIRKKENSCHICADRKHNRLCRCGMITVTSCIGILLLCPDWVKHDDTELSYCAHSMKASTSRMHSINQPFSVQIKTQSQPHLAQNETLLVLHSTQSTVNCALQTLVNHLCRIHLIFLPKMYMNINVHAIKPATNRRSVLCGKYCEMIKSINLAVLLFSLISLHRLHQLWKASEGSRWTITCRIIKHRKSPRVYKYRPLQSFTEHHSNHQHYFWM